ncbi:MAG: hypothetical protein HY399_05180 [Elusimicrobia bacterium]|nr:hypothetical protein [Elusimicrobiota bacterium]
MNIRRGTFLFTGSLMLFLGLPPLLRATPTVAILQPLPNSTTNSMNIIFGTANGCDIQRVGVDVRNNGYFWDEGVGSFSAPNPKAYVATGTGTWSYPPSQSLKASLLSGNTYFIRAEAQDSCGANPLIEVVTSSFTFFNAPPSVGIVTPADNAQVAAPTTLSGTASQSSPSTPVQNVYISIQRGDTGMWLSGNVWTSTFELFVLVSGTNPWSYSIPPNTFADCVQYYVHARAEDNLYNQGHAFPRFTVDTGGCTGGDTQSPSSLIQYPVNGSTITALTITGTASDNISVDRVFVAIQRLRDNYWWVGSNWQFANSTGPASAIWGSAQGQANWNYNGLPDYQLESSATYKIISQALDLAGNRESPGSSVQFTFSPSSGSALDTTPPYITITYPPPGANLTSLGSISGTAMDNVLVSSVSVAVKRLNDFMWWNDTTLNWVAAGPIFNFSTVTANTTFSNWNYSGLADSYLTGDSSYTITAKARDSSGNFSETTSQFMFVSSQPANNADGSGLATITPANVFCGTATVTVVYTVSGATLTAGGAVAVHFPDPWYPSPQNHTPASLGFFDFWTSTFTGSTLLDPLELNPGELGTNWARLRIQSGGKLVPGEKIFFRYLTTPASYSGPTQQVIDVRSKGSNSGTLLALKSGQPFVNFSAGPPSWIQHDSYDSLVVGAGQASPSMKFMLIDQCGNSATAGTNIPIDLILEDISGLSDSQVKFSSSTSFTIPDLTSRTTIYAGSPLSPSFYLTTTSTGNFNVVGSFSALGGGRAYRYATIFSAGALSFSSVSIDTGTAGTATSVTLTPDGSGSAFAYINFTLSDPSLTWKVSISRDNFATVVFDRIGTGNPGRTLGWDGRDVYNQQVVPNGTYTVKIQYLGSGVQNTSLSIAVQSSSISGKVLKNGVPLEGARISVSGGPAGPGTFAVSDNLGNYSLQGLRAGERYNLFASTQLPNGQTVNGQLNDIQAPQSAADIALQTPTTLRVRALLTKPAPFESWGSVEVRDSNFISQGYGTIHFSSGSVASDNGYSYYGVAASSWTEILLNPGTYSVQLNLYGLGLSTGVSAVTIAAATTSELSFTFSKKSDVFGYVFLPSTQTYGTGISVEGRKQGDSFPTVFGGVYLRGSRDSGAPAVSSGIYSLWGLEPGIWTLTARAYGFAPQSLVVTVADLDLGNIQTGGVDFLPFSQGSVVGGTITVQGDTSQIVTPSCAGCYGFTLYINAYNPATFTHAHTQVSLATSTTLSSATFQLGGLTDGTYQLFTHLDGFQMDTQGGPPQATVSGGVGSANITLKQFAGQMRATFLLPAGRSDFDQVSLDVFGPQVNFSTNNVASMSGIAIDVANSSATLLSPKLGTGFYSVKAVYRPLGTVVAKTIPVIDGTITPVLADLRGSTFKVSGTVSLSGTLVINTSNYAVSVSSIAGLVANAPQDIFFSSGSSLGLNSTTTARMELLNLEMQRFGPQNSAAEGSIPTFGLGELYFAPIKPDGTYQIANVPPGQYLLKNHADLNANSADGFEMSPQEKVVTVIDSDLSGHNFIFTNGVSISGTISLPPGVSETRPLAAEMRNLRGDAVQTVFLNLNNSNSVEYTFNKVPNGQYALILLDRAQPVKYVVQPKNIEVTGTSLTQQNFSLVAGGVIKAKIALEEIAADGTRSYRVIGSLNQHLLPPGYRVFARANPWKAGAFGSANTDCSTGACQLSFDGSDQITIPGLLPANYDVDFGNKDFDPSAAGQGSLNLLLITKSQISVAAGQIVNIGTVNLKPGVSLIGTVRDQAGTALSNIPVSAYPTASDFDLNQMVNAFTNENGQFTLNSLSSELRYYDVIAAPRLDSENRLSNDSLVPYAESKKSGVDLKLLPSLNFVLALANSSLTGRIITPDGSVPKLPFGQQQSARTGEEFPGALVLVQKVGELPKKNPIGDIEFVTDTSGNFQIVNLATGSYRITALAKGFGSVQTIAKISQSNSNVNVGSLSLALGASLSGSISLPNGDHPNDTDINAIVAASSDFSAVIIGSLTKDPNSKQITGYSLSGFKQAIPYQIVLIGDGDQATVPAEGMNVTFSTTTESRSLNLVFRPNTPLVFGKIRKVGSNFDIHLQCTQPLRNKTSADADPNGMVSLVSGAGSLSGHSLSLDRKELTVQYAPAAGDTSFKIRWGPVYTSAVNPDSLDTTNPEFVVSSTFTFFIGVNAFNESTINGVLGGSVALEGDTSRVDIPAGALQVDVSSSIKVTMQKSDSNTGNETQSLAVEGKFRRLAYAPEAYPSDLYRAMAALPPTVQPFSAFYDVLLPLGVRTALSKSAKLTIYYSTGTGAPDPASMNIYWYNSASNIYVLQQNLCGGSPEIDYANQTITICVNHFSVFVALGANVAVITGNAFAKGDIEVFNFPNPFNLETKTLSLIHSAAAPSVRGTLIHVGLPAALSGDVKVEIYNVAGERVKTLDMGNLSGGSYYYAEWDGRNDSGKDAASGVYIGMVKVGSSKKFFKMALIR